MSRDCPAAAHGATCGRIGAHRAHAGLAEDGTLRTWNDDEGEATMPGPKHDVSPVPDLEAGGRTVRSWRAVCDTCGASGPERAHRSLAAHDADRHRPHGDAFPEGRAW